MWVAEACCSLLQRPYQRDLLLQQFAAPHDSVGLLAALAELGVLAQPKRLKVAKLKAESFPLLVWLDGPSDAVTDESQAPSEMMDLAPSNVDAVRRPALVLQADSEKAYRASI